MNSTVNVYVAGKNVAALLGTVPTPDGMTVHVECLPSGAIPLSSAQTVFILKSLPSEIIPGVKYILCTPNHPSIPPSVLDSLYDLWPEPLTPSLLKFYYRKLMERIRSEQLNTSEYAEHQKRMTEMARQDYLTGLATRWYLQEYFNENAAEDCVTCIYFDLDNFKAVNDTWGHQAGDRALAATAEMMQREFADGFCTRMGGDEFMIVLLGARSVSDVVGKVNAFMAGLLEYYAGTKTMKALSVSAGISQKVHGEDKTADRLIHESDIALYEAKKSGRGCCRVYAPEMEESHEVSRNYYLVDYENVHAGGLDGIHKLGADSTVCIFYSRNASTVTSGLNMGIRESKAEITYHHAEAGTKNALDFQLSSYLGELITENSGNNCHYYIVSQDGGFSGLVPFWKEKGIDLEIIPDISGQKTQKLSELAERVAVLTGDSLQASAVAEIIMRCRTKVEVNTAIQRLYRNEKSGMIYRSIRPLIEGKPGQPRQRQVL